MLRASDFVGFSACKRLGPALLNRKPRLVAATTFATPVRSNFRAPQLGIVGGVDVGPVTVIDARL